MFVTAFQVKFLNGPAAGKGRGKRDRKGRGKGKESQEPAAEEGRSDYPFSFQFHQVTDWAREYEK